MVQLANLSFSLNAHSSGAQLSPGTWGMASNKRGYREISLSISIILERGFQAEFTAAVGAVLSSSQLASRRHFRCCFHHETREVLPFIFSTTITMKHNAVTVTRIPEIPPLLPSLRWDGPILSFSVMRYLLFSFPFVQSRISGNTIYRHPVCKPYHRPLSR